VSSHLYPTDPWAHEAALPKGRDDFYAAIAGAADIVEASAKKHGLVEVPPFVLTEFNCGLGMGCQDSYYSGSFIAHHALNSQGIVHKVPIQSYWTFSDIFEEGGQQPQEFAGAFGTRTFNGTMTMTSTSFWAILRAFLSSTSPHMRCGPCSKWQPC